MKNSRPSEASSDGTVNFLLLLYGSYEQDGRVQRMVGILECLGSVMILHTGSRSGLIRTGHCSVHAQGLRMQEDASPIQRHMRFAREALKLTRKLSPRVIVAEDYFTCVPGWIAALIGGAKLVYDAHELIAPADSEQMSLRRRAWYYGEWLAMARVDLVFAANPDRCRIMAEHYNLEKTPTPLRNIPPLAPHGRPTEGNEVVALMERLRAQHKHLLLYQGYVSLKRGLDSFVAALAHLPEAFHFVIVGSGPDIDAVKRLVCKQGLRERVTITGPISQDKLRYATEMGDVGIVTYPYKGLNNVYCASNKVFEYAQSGLPVICTAQPPLLDIVRKYGIGSVIHEGYAPEEIARVIQDLVEALSAFRPGLARLVEDHTWEKEANRAISQIERIICGRSAE